MPMFALTRHLRGLAIAAVVLAISAGAVFAGAGGLQLPTSTPQANEEPTVEEPTVEEPDAEEPTEGTEDSEDADATEADGTHGTQVSEAAGMETPEGFANHGEFVSCVAKLNKGQWGGGEPAVPVVLADLTPEACAALAEEAAAAKDAAKAAAKAERDAAKAERAAPARPPRPPARPHGQPPGTDHGAIERTEAGATGAGFFMSDGVPGEGRRRSG
jgi:hypothetical protein